MITALCWLLSATLAAAPFVPTPREQLIAKVILMEVVQDGAARPSGTRADPGQCRRFQANVFSEAAAGYRANGYPDTPLFLPTEHNDPEATGRMAGTCWDMPPLSEGNAFYEVAHYDRVSGQGRKEALEAAYAFLAQVKAGDVLQMLATYNGGGHGTHTILFTRPYDPRINMLYWADSNFTNRIVDGVKLGVVKAYQNRSVEEVAGWLVESPGDGATLYRVVDGIVPVK